MDDFATLQASVQSNLVSTTRGVSRLVAEDLPFHRTLEPSLGTELDAQNARLLELAQRLLGSATTNTEAVRPSLRDIDDVEGNWTMVVDVIDSLLERADTALDEFTGAVKRLTPRETTPNAKPHPHKLAAAFRNQNIEKPQLLFLDTVDNHFELPFQPLLTSKPHSSIPLQTEPTALEETDAIGFRHPYQHEIERFTYPPSIYESSDPVPYLAFDQTEATLVDSEEALSTMIEELKSAKEIAVDLEHHDHRSYIGIVSLMQISTRNRDWIVDTLKPWRRKLSCLNEVFTDPSIVKVLHGAYMDIVWLQRDLGLYVVGLFDTYSAARSLGYPQASYAYLLKRFTDVDAQKQFQMADWRIRPLPKELVDYARSDTHYLLYVFDHMRNELLEKSKLSAPDHAKDKIWDVQERSKETALQLYEHPGYDVESGQGAAGWLKMLSRTAVNFTKEQFSVFRAIHRWRDSVAREQDDSLHYVMPNHMVFSIARSSPTTKVDLLKAAQPLTQTVRLRIDELVAAISQAQENAEDGPDMMEVLTRFDPVAARKLATHDSQAAKGSDGAGTYLQRVSTMIASALPLRSMSSSFWGSSAGETNKQQKRQLSTVQIAVPLPPLSDSVFAKPTGHVEVETVSQPPSQESAEQEQEDDIFVLRELNRKRKLSNNEDVMQLQDDEVALPDDAAEQAQQKAERKRARKEAKRAAKTPSEVINAHPGDEPFDYASAPSVLNQPAPDKKAKKQKKKSFDPYSKSMQTPKGLPRVQKESAEGA